MRDKKTVLNVTELDFDNIKENLKDFLKNQDHLKDYDFEGSAISTIIELLAYNTHYQSYYLNMIANEMFLDSALLRSSVVSKAKHLNYTPRSNKAAVAHIELEVVPYDSPISVTLDRNTKFTSSVGGKTLTFVPLRSYTLPRVMSGNTAIYKKKGIVLKQGTPLSFKWTVSRQNKGQRFIIPNKDIDTSTLLVRIQYSPNSDYSEEFKIPKDTNRITGKDNIYFLQEVEDELYEIYFGDGLLGKQLENNNIIHINYLATDGQDGNHGSIFTTNESISGYNKILITTEMKSVGGDERETIESIRFNAPRTFEGQDRAVTIRDYRTILPKIFPNIQSLNIWGGEDNIPPYYGRVMIAIKPDDGYYLSAAVKKHIENQLIKDWSIVSITPMVIDPEYTFVVLNVNIKFDDIATVLTADEIRNKAEDAIVEYNSETLSKFDSYFRYSKFVSMIDGVDRSITNNLTTVKMKKKIVPTMHTKTYYELKYNNKIVPGSLETTFFDIGNKLIEGAIPNNRYFVDDKNGNINLNIMINGKEETYVAKMGTIDYTTGTIKIQKLKINWFIGDSIDFTVTPIENDIIPQQNQIISVDLQDLIISTEVDIEK